MKIAFFFQIMILLLLYGCVKHIHHNELLEVENLGNTFPAYLWYMGTKNGYDYFHASFNKKRDLGYAGIYKVVSQETKIKKRFAFTKNEKLWVQYPIDFSKIDWKNQSVFPKRYQK